MIRVQRGPVPADLRSPAADDERARARALYANPANCAKTFDFKVYKADGVRRALNEAFRGKCAYCESSYAGTQPLDVEHYRPKGAVATGRPGNPPCGTAKGVVKPGYYWLASEWSNLLPSCSDCNRPRTQEFRDHAGTAGKANMFPIDNEDDRATTPGEEKEERRLLLHPYFDFPERHLRFADDGWVDPVSKKGKASIEVFALTRQGLCRDRLRVLTHMQVAMRVISIQDQDLAANPRNATMRTRRDQALAHMEQVYAGSDAEYVAMARQAIERFRATLGP